MKKSESGTNIRKYPDEIEILLDMLIQSGRAMPMEDTFTIEHDDVVTMLELIRERVVTVNDECMLVG